MIYLTIYQRRLVGGSWAHSGTLRSQTRLVEHWGDLVAGVTERRRTALLHTLAGNELHWSKVTPKSKTRQTPGSLNFAANFRRGGTSRSQLVRTPFGRTRTTGRLTPTCFRLVHASFQNNQVSGAVWLPRRLAQVTALVYLYAYGEPRLLSTLPF